ncbi:MAG: TIGR02646 family protein [bacterium]|nr:TIGR02646 family protein [bacterium]
MIRLEPKPPAPDVLTGEDDDDKVVKAKERIRQKILTGKSTTPKDFPSHWSDVKGELHTYQNGKCCYCERYRDPEQDSDVEHFRPKGRVAEDDAHPGYWWLAYEWDNLFFSCKSCNERYKKDMFPLLPDGQRVDNDKADLTLEKPVLIHPVEDDPEEYIGFDWQIDYGIIVKAVGLDAEGRGNSTVKELTAINKKTVMEERARLISGLQLLARNTTFAIHSDNQALLEQCGKNIQRETAAENSFAGFRRAFFRAHGLGEYVSKDR